MFNLARILFFVSLSATLFWLTGLFYEATTKTDPPIFLTGIIVTIIGALITSLFIKHVPGFLKTEDASWTPFKVYLFWVVTAYFVTMPIATGIGYLYLLVGGRQTPALEGDADIFLIIITWWLPLWWSVGAGMVIAWFRNRKEWYPTNKNAI